MAFGTHICCISRLNDEIPKRLTFVIPNVLHLSLLIHSTKDHFFAPLFARSSKKVCVLFVFEKKKNNSSDVQLNFVHTKCIEHYFFFFGNRFELRSVAIHTLIHHRIDLIECEIWCVIHALYCVWEFEKDPFLRSIVVIEHMVNGECWCSQSVDEIISNHCHLLISSQIGQSIIMINRKNGKWFLSMSKQWKRFDESKERSLICPLCDRVKSSKRRIVMMWDFFF